jgi:hypothetical protein
LPSSSFANDRERRGDDEEEEWGSVVIGHHGPAWMSDGRMGEGIGVSLTSRLLSRVGQNSGRGGKWNETTINCKRGGCIVVVVIKGGGRRGKVASSSLSHEGDGVGKRCGGRETATKVAGGEAVSSMSSLSSSHSSGVSKDSGERVAEGRQQQWQEGASHLRHRHFVVVGIGVDSDPSRQAPPSPGRRRRWRRRKRVARWRESTINIISAKKLIRKKSHLFYFIF